MVSYRQSEKRRRENDHLLLKVWDKQMKSTRKKCLAILPIPALLICALAFSFGAYAAEEEPSPLNKGTLFTEAERDLDALSSSREYVALWATDAVPDSSVTFILEEAIAETYKPIRNSTGLRIRRLIGTRMIIR